MSVLTLMSWLKYTTLTMCDMRKASDVMSLSDPALLSRSNNEKKQIDKQKQTSVKGKEYKKVNKSSVFFLKNHSCKSNVFSPISARLPLAWSGSL